MSTSDAKLLNPSEQAEPELLRRSSVRWLAIFLIGALNIGYMFSSDYSSILQNYLLDIGITEIQLSLFQTVYSFPNLILPLAAGIIIDKVGTRLCIIIFCLILFLGQTITTIGTVWLPNEGDSPEHLNSALMVMLVGRTIFACGAESLFVSINVVTAEWFEGKELGFAFSIQTAIGMVIRSSANVILIKFAEDSLKSHGGIFWPLFATAISCAFSSVCSFFYSYIDKRAQNQENSLGIKTKAIQKQAFRLSDIKKLNFLFWILNVYDIFSIAESVSFNTLSMNYYLTQYNVQSVISGRVLSIVGLMNLCVVLSLGQVLKKIGKYGVFIAISGVLTILKYVLYLVLPRCPDYHLEQPDALHYNCVWSIIPPILVNALTSCIINVALFTAIALVVQPKVLGSAYGLLDCFQMVGMLTVPLIGAVIQSSTDKWDGYYYFLVFFLAINIFNGCISAWTFFYDYTHLKLLHDPKNNQLQQSVTEVENESQNTQTQNVDHYSFHRGSFKT